MSNRKISLAATYACVLVLVVASMAGCPNPIARTTDGSLTIQFANNVNARTLLPPLDMTVASYTVSGTGPGGAEFTQTSSGGPVTATGLVFGSWTVTVNALNGGGTPIGSGQVTADVHTGQTTAVTVSVVPLAGPGALDLTVTWTASQVEHASIQASLTPPSGSATPLVFSIIGSQGTFSSGSIPAGYQTLTLQLLDNEIPVMGAVEVVRIVKGQTTTGTYAFTNVNGPGGSVQVNITPEMADPIPVEISPIGSPIGAGTSITAEASVTDGTANVVYVWYLNGESRGTGSTLSLGSSLLAGYYRLDVTAYTADGKRGGSDSAGFQVTGTASARPYLFVGNGASNSISSFSIGSNGALTMVSGSPVGAGTQPLTIAVDPTGKFLYAANYISNDVSAFTIGSGGALTAVSGSPVATGMYPQSIVIPPSGKFVYVGSTASATIWAYAIGSTGALTPLSGSPFPISGRSYSLALDPTGSFLFAATSESRTIAVFSIGSFGALTPVSGSPFPTSAPTGRIAIEPRGKFLYGLSGSSTVAGWSIGSTGALTPLAGPLFPTGSNPMSVSVDPMGRFVFVADLNLGVFVYTIESTGTLTPVSGSPFAAGTVAVAAAADPTGQFLYVANAGSNYTVSAFTIGTTGTLTPVGGSPFYSGYSPFCLAFVTKMGAP